MSVDRSEGRAQGRRRNPFQTRSTTSIRSLFTIHSLFRCRNPFQTRSTTSMRPRATTPTKSFPRVAIPSKPGQRLQCVDRSEGRAQGRQLSQSLPNQVNDFNIAPGDDPVSLGECRNPFQTRSTTSIIAPKAAPADQTNCRNPFQTRSTTSMH